MPPPNNVPELLDRVRRSGVVPADRLESFLVGLQCSERPPTAPADVLARLVEAGLITQFHADKFALGKYKGFQLGGYLILDQIGSGGMGQVYLAEHVNMRRLVALKVLSPYSFEHDPIAKARFFREARAAAALDHPNVVRVFDLCQEGKILFLVMEFVEGISLQAVVTRYGPLDVPAACNYARQVAFGLQHAHELGFVHRDIKPANLLIDALGVVKILDLGLVWSEAEVGKGLTKQLDHKSILGTADYVAPEQAVDSSNVDIRADVYSLGATLYFLLSGRPLFPEGRTAQKLVWQQLKEPVSVDRLRPEVPAALAALVHRMLQKKPEDRFQSPAEVFDELAPFVPDDVPPPDPAWLPPSATRVAVARAAAAGAIATRSTGSTSQVLAAAMRSGSGTTPTSVTRRNRPTSPGDGSSVADRLTNGHSSGLRKGSDAETTINAAGQGDTQRTPAPDVLPASDSPTRALPSTPLNPTVIISALTAALILALLGIVILLLRG